MAVSAAPSEPNSATTDNGQLLAADGIPLSTKLARATRRSRIQAFLLVLPLLAFVLVFFVTPIVKMALLSISDDVFLTEMPKTSKALESWNGQGIPDEPVFKALVEDLIKGRENRTTAKVGGQLNFIYSGARSLVVSTGRSAKRFKAPFKDAVINKDERWKDPVLWQLIRTVSTTTTSIYYLNAVDRTVNAKGEVVQVNENIRIHLQIFWRTLWLSGFVTFLCFLLGYPVAYLLAHLPTKTSNLLLICVLLPFWTSLLVRITAWIALLQNDGVILSTLVSLGLIADQGRPQLVYNMFGTVVAMVHVLMPLMILPIFSVMKTISPSYMRAARSLGATKVTAFRRVYFPQTLPGIAAGSMLVFILSVGYYITPALLGGQSGVLISNFIALHMESTLNWGLAAALGTLLLGATLVLYWLFNTLIGIDKLKVG